MADVVPGLDIITFGCRLNSFESEVMRTHADAAGVDDLVVVHTCAVTAEAERQARQAIRKARRDHPDRRIVVTGCSAQITPERYAAMAEVDHVVGNQDKLLPGYWRQLGSTDRPARTMVGDIMAVRETAGHLVDGLDGRTRAFLQIQNGCDHRCTFCIIPFGRGPSRSVPIGELVAQARRLVASGFAEVVLTGVDLTSYGRDLPGTPSLGQLVRRLLRLVPELARLRLSSLDPAEVDPDLKDQIAAEPRLMPHIHLSVQAGDPMILKRMKRRHSRDDVLALAAELRRLRPGLALGADLIAGFPTETEAMFERTLDLVDEADLAFLHVFPYSARSGTPAARMPQLPVALRKERAARLRQRGSAVQTRFLARQVGRPARVLIERDGGGRTENFVPFELEPASPQAAVGTIVTAVADRVADNRLIGHPAP